MSKAVSTEEDKHLNKITETLNLYTDQVRSLRETVANLQDQQNKNHNALLEKFSNLTQEIKDMKSSTSLSVATEFMNIFKTTTQENHQAEVGRYMQLLDQGQKQQQAARQQLEMVQSQIMMLSLQPNSALNQQLAQQQLAQQQLIAQQMSVRNVQPQSFPQQQQQQQQQQQTVRQPVPVATNQPNTFPTRPVYENQIAPLTNSGFTPAVDAPPKLIAQQPVPAQVPAAAPVQAAQPPKSTATTGFGDAFKLKEGEWTCKECMVRNKREFQACQCCQTAKDGTAADSKPAAAPFTAQKFNAPASAQSFNFGTGKPVTEVKVEASSPSKPTEPQKLFGSTTGAKAAEPTKPTFSFASPAQSSPSTASKPSEAISFSFTPKPVPAAANSTPVANKSSAAPFSFTPTSNASDKPANSSIFGSNSLFGSQAKPFSTFDALAKNDKPSFLSGSNENAFKMDPKNAPIFKSLNDSGKDKDTSKVGQNTEEEPEAFQPDESQFIRPQIELPDLVDLKTGEENEDIIFRCRAKVYRYNGETKDVKERGTGELKLLRHKETGKVRCLMRRDQVLKLCANFACPSDMKLTFAKGKPSTLVFTCCDYSDTIDHPEGEHMTMLCRLKEAKDANSFKHLIETAGVGAPVITNENE